jgi:hypothetical protein
VAGKQVEQAAGAGDAIFHGFRAACVIEHCFAKHAAHVAARVHVIADESDAVSGKAPGADGQKAVANGFSHPGVQSVREDVVELARACIGEIAGDHVDITESQRRRFLPRSVDGPRRQIYTHERGFREMVRHGDEVPTIAAADLEYAAALNARGPHPEQSPYGRQPVRMRFAARQRRVGDFVIRRFRHVSIIGYSIRGHRVSVARTL